MDLTGAKWRKSKHSSQRGDDCVEVATIPATVAVRDSKNPNGGNILLTRGDFRHFAEAIKAL
jgi:hypothetical protein